MAISSKVLSFGCACLGILALPPKTLNNMGIRMRHIARRMARGVLLRFRFLRRYDSVFRCLSDPKLHHLLGGDLDGFASGRVTSHARLAIHPDQSPNAGQYEYAILLDLTDCRLKQSGEQALRDFLGYFALLCQCLDDLSLRHCSPLSAY